MKNLKDIIEGLKIGSKTKVITYSCKPKDKDELIDIIEERLKENKNANLNDIDVSDITDMYNLFFKLDPLNIHNIDISDWDVSKVKDMGYMFQGCINFNCDLSKWNVKNVENMRGMFVGCKNFNCDLSGWDISNVKDRWSMFYGCDSLKIKNRPKLYKY